MAASWLGLQCVSACLLYNSASMDCTGMMCFRVIGSTSFFLMGHKAGLAHLCCLQPDTLPDHKVEIFAGCTELMLCICKHMGEVWCTDMCRVVEPIVVAMQACKRLILRQKGRCFQLGYWSNRRAAQPMQAIATEPKTTVCPGSNESLPLQTAQTPQQGSCLAVAPCRKLPCLAAPLSHPREPACVTIWLCKHGQRTGSVWSVTAAGTVLGTAENHVWHCATNNNSCIQNGS